MSPLEGPPTAEVLADSEETRKLATLRTVNSIEPIEGADFIEIAKLDGWQCIVKKGEFKEGDLAIYFEIDSFLPIDERYEFLRKSSYKKTVDGKEGFRLRTMKLRGQVSQGLALPLAGFTEVTDIMRDVTLLGNIPTDTDEFIGMDVTKDLNITKWDPPLPAELGGKVEGRKPDFFPKTDQERIQNLPKILNDKDSVATFEATEKIDGTSMSVYRLAFESELNQGVCGRNYAFKDDVDNSYTQAEKKYHILDILAIIGTSRCPLSGNVAVQGELAGPGIQKNPLGLEEQQFFVYDIYLINEGRYATFQERADYMYRMNEIASKNGWPSILHVPIFTTLIRPLQMSMETILGESEIRSNLNKDKWAEGIVYKSRDLVNGQVMSFKVINNKYLLKHGG
jgi:RNA ligase (TIGR02306 family)